MYVCTRARSAYFLYVPVSQLRGVYKRGSCGHVRFERVACVSTGDNTSNNNNYVVSRDKTIQYQRISNNLHKGRRRTAAGIGRYTCRAIHGRIQRV